MNREDKIDIDLKGIPQTLLLPLLGRAVFSQKKNPPVHDEQAIKLLQTLNYNFNELLERLGGEDSTLWWIGRAYHFDQAIKEFIKKHPTATIVNLGAGLDTTFYRIDNGKLTWVDIDLPDVINLRKKLFPISERVHQISKSVLDYSWMQDVKQFGKEVIFIAGGFFMYFEEDQVKSLLIEMSNKFPRSELIFDAIEKRGIKYANRMLDDVKMRNAVIKCVLPASLCNQQFLLSSINYI